MIHRSWLLRSFGAFIFALSLGGSVLAASVVYEYDQTGRLRKATYEDGTVTDYVLDAAGNRTSVTSTVSTAIGTLQFTAATFSVSEAGPTATITVSRAGGANGAVGITVATSNGTATAGSDYTAISQTLSWANGETGNKSVSVAINNDSAFEGNETVNVALSAPTGGATLGSPASTVLTINDNDVAAFGSLSFGSATYTVGEAGPSIGLTVNRTSGSDGAVGITYNTTNGNATAGSDYTAQTNQTLSWVHGDATAKTITVPISNDALVEGTENFNVVLSAPSGGATLGSPSTAVVTINDNDNLPAGAIQFTVTSINVSEGAGQVTLTASRTGGSSGGVGATYNTANGTATAGSDYTARTNLNVGWAPGDTADKTITVPITNDPTFEGNETFTVTLSAPLNGATLGPNSTITVTINEDDSPPVFSIANASVSEATSSVTMTVTKTGATLFAHSVNYGTANGTAIAGSDYTTASGTLAFAAGETSKTFTVPIIDDAVYEGANETFTAALSSPTNGASVGGAATVTIVENDNPPAGAIQFTVTSISVSEGAGQVTLTASRTGGSFGGVGATYNTADGTATAGSDYTARTNLNVGWAPGDTADKTITVPITNDPTFEGNETFTVTLSAPLNGATLGPNSTITVTINNDDPATTVTISDMNVWSMGTSSAEAHYYLSSSGDITANPPGTPWSDQDVGDWLTPKTGMANYDVIAENPIGSLCQGTFNTWQSLSASRGWATESYSSPGIGVDNSCSFIVKIRLASNPSVILDTATINLNALAQD